jgi:two-component system, cell cycle response regulator DivK
MSHLNRHILLVEDDESNRRLLTFFLQELGYRVTCVVTSSEAFSLAQTEHFDLYLLGDWPPFGEENRLCTQINEFDPRGPVLFLSAAAYPADQQRGMEAGAQGYLTKPCDLYNLGQVVSHLLQEPLALPPAQTWSRNSTLGVNANPLKPTLLSNLQEEGGGGLDEQQGAREAPPGAYSDSPQNPAGGSLRTPPLTGRRAEKESAKRPSSLFRSRCRLLLSGRPG